MGIDSAAKHWVYYESSVVSREARKILRTN